MYSIVRQTDDFPPDAFVFEPPPGVTLTEMELPIPRPMGSPEMPRGPGISLPRLVSKKEPKYGELSRKARVEGAVVLYVVIGTDGRPSEVLLYRRLTPDLDEAAMSSVRKWRFKPGTKDGKPVALPVTIEVNFRLL